MEKDTYNFIFVRHGETEWNVKGVIAGQLDKSKRCLEEGILDASLNEKGIKEAETLYLVLQQNKIEVDLIITSPLKRAFETGQCVAKKLEIEIEKEEKFREMFFGDCEGCILEDLRKKEFEKPLEYTAPNGEKYFIKNGQELRECHFSTDKKYDNLCHPGGETKLQVSKRAKEGLLDIIKKHSKKSTFLIPTHNALLRFFMSTIDRKEAGNVVDHTEIVHVTYNSNTQEWQIKRRIKNSMKRINFSDYQGKRITFDL